MLLSVLALIHFGKLVAPSGFPFQNWNGSWNPLESGQNSGPECIDKIMYYLVFLSGYLQVSKIIVMFTKGCGFESHLGSPFQMESHF
jgi:hypothetical protein